jgi:hypothetical protein
MSFIFQMPLHSLIYDFFSHSSFWEQRNLSIPAVIIFDIPDDSIAMLHSGNKQWLHQ